MTQCPRSGSALAAPLVCLLLSFALTAAACGGASDEAADASPSAADTSGDDAATDPDGAEDSGPAADDTDDDDTAEPVEPVVCTDLGATGDLIVTTTLGPVEGHPTQQASEWLGVPFAAAPVGSLRWRPPAVHACYDTVVEAADYGPECPQTLPLQGKVGDEDCLTLNVWAPADTAPDAALPVLFFVHGGGNVQGSSSKPLQGGAPTYSGHHIVERADVVVVTTNYRLGALGFLALPDLSSEADSQSSGNYGLLDQIAALGWVRDNIAGFGGDPDRVLLFGESAGASDTCALMASPLAAGLFHRALMQSGGCPGNPLAETEATGASVVEAGPCGDAADVLACLRGLTASEILDVMPGSINVGSVDLGKQTGSYGPTQDGWVLPTSPLEAFASGAHNAVPLVIGANADEMVDMASVEVTTADEYEDVVTLMFGLFGAAVLETVFDVYPVDSHPTPQDTLVQLLSDMRFVCPAREIARAVAGGQSEAVYRYFFTKRAETNQGDLPARHGIELLYVFRTMTDIPLFQPADSDLDLADAMIGYWTRFAATGDPNGADAPVWPEFEANADPYLDLTWPPVAGEGVHSERCDMWLELVSGL